MAYVNTVMVLVGLKYDKSHQENSLLFLCVSTIQVNKDDQIVSLHTVTEPYLQHTEFMNISLP